MLRTYPVVGCRNARTLSFAKLGRVETLRYVRHDMLPARLLSARTVGVLAATGVAGIATLVTRTGWVATASVAASPGAIAKGKLWLLITSGVVADKPWLASLIGFAVVTSAVLAVAPLRLVVAAALAGQVLATLAVYGALGVARSIDHNAFATLVHKPDIGLSAIIAAWIGVVSHAFWHRFRSHGAHLLNGLGCIGCALVGFAFRPDVTALDSEHIVAFALGAAVAAWWPRRLPLEFASGDIDRELEDLLAGRT